MRIKKYYLDEIFKKIKYENKNKNYVIWISSKSADFPKFNYKKYIRNE